jgi:uncharacterized protein YjiS (DUF1127 family)
VTRRRKRRPRSAGSAPSPPPLDAESTRLLEETRAELFVEKQDVLPRNQKLERRVGKAFAALDRALESASSDAPGPGFVARLRTRITAWRRRRRQRLSLVRLDRALARRDVRVADHSSSALLAIVTERIARIATADESAQDLAATIDVAQHVVDEYRAYLQRLEHMRDSARGAAATWREKSAAATAADRADLVALADDTVREWSRREQEVAAALESCEAGRRRLDDAIAQLRALAKRTATRDRS